MLFYIGFMLMVLNEGFVILRHAVPRLAAARNHLIKRYGIKWQILHSLLDTAWIVLIVLGFVMEWSQWPTYLLWLSIFWGCVAVYYLVVFRKKIFK